MILDLVSCSVYSNNIEYSVINNEYNIDDSDIMDDNKYN